MIRAAPFKPAIYMPGASKIPRAIGGSVTECLLPSFPEHSWLVRSVSCWHDEPTWTEELRTDVMRRNC